MFYNVIVASASASCVPLIVLFENALLYIFFTNTLPQLWQTNLTLPLPLKPVPAPANAPTGPRK